MAAADQLTGLINLINGVKGSSQTTKTGGGKQTQQVQLSDAAVNEQIKRILAGSGGVADIGNAARKSGLYNSTSEELLLGNLYATAAAQGEIARAPVVTTTAPVKQTTETPGVGIGTALGTVAGAAIINSLIGSGTNAVGTGITDLLGNIFGGGKKSTDVDLAGVDGGVSIDPTAGSVGVSGSFSEGSGDYGLGGSFSGNDFTTQMGLGLSGISENQVGASGNISKGSEDFDLMGSIGQGLTGLFSGGGLGGLLGAITGGTGFSGGGGGSGATSGGSVICTALMEKGELDAELYKLGSEYLEQLNPLVKAGYHAWAIGVAEKIRKGSKVVMHICRPVARSRTALLATSGNFWDHLKHPLGSITKFIGEPVCYVIGWVLVTGALHRELAQELNSPFGLK